MRVVFMGSPDFAVPALEALVDAGHEVTCVYCQPPRPAGRGKREQPTAVQARAAKLGLPVRHPAALSAADVQQEFAALGADVAVVAAFGLILPQAVLDAPRYGCINIHASLLPRWRGAAPIHRAIMAGDSETGVAIMQMEAGLDTGPVLLRGSQPITAADTTASLHDKLAAQGAQLLIQTLSSLDSLKATPQDTVGVTYAQKIDKSEARIDWTRSAAEVDRQIRGLCPFPGAWTMALGDRIKCLGSELVEDTGTSGPPGQVLSSDLKIACGQGTLRLTQLQRAGKSAQDSGSFLRGFALPVGTELG